MISRPVMLESPKICFGEIVACLVGGDQVRKWAPVNEYKKYISELNSNDSVRIISFFFLQTRISKYMILMGSTVKTLRVGSQKILQEAEEFTTGLKWKWDNWGI